MDIIFSNESIVSQNTRAHPTLVNEFSIYPLRFVYTHVEDGYEDVCILTPVQATKHLTTGSYAAGLQMYTLENDSNVKFIAKIIDAEDSEVRAVNALMNMIPSKRCNVIQARIVDLMGQRGHKMTLMPDMEGDLDSQAFNSMMDSVNPEIRKSHIRTIMASVYEQLNCLNNAGLIYNDIKPPNILFMYDRKSHVLNVQLCDLGSCEPQDSKEFITTIPCFQKLDPLAEMTESWEGEHYLYNPGIAKRCQKETMDTLLFYLFMRFICQHDLKWNVRMFMNRNDENSIQWKIYYRDLIRQSMPDMMQYFSF